MIVDKPDSKTGQFRYFPRYFFLITNWLRTLPSRDTIGRVPEISSLSGLQGEGRKAIFIAITLQGQPSLVTLKEPSLLAFQERRQDVNMKNIFRILQVPSDTQMREILDPLEPDLLRPMFNDVSRELQRGKLLEAFDFFEGHCLLSMDGSGYYSSKKVHCKHRLQRTNSKTGEITWHHQMLAAALVHPDLKQVVPLAL